MTTFCHNTNTNITSSTRRRQVVLFGLSADPPTGEGGHVGIVKALSAMTEFEEIRVLPVYRHNLACKRDRLLPFHDRMRMCELAFHGIPRVVVSDCERACFDQKMKGKQKKDEEAKTIRVGTADLLEMIMEREPDTLFSFALGGDTFMDLTNWKWNRSRDILKLLEGRFIVLPRQGEVPEAMLKDRIAAINTDEGGHARMVTLHSLQNISSTKVRSISDLDKLEGMITPAVLDYMVRHKLYGFADPLI